MCGIVGLIGDHEPLPMKLFLEMRDSIAHRGPDAAGVWESPSGKARLGTRRLAILDLSASGRQPMEDEASGLVIAFNGEIYNYLELKQELARQGCRFRSHSDTEVLLKSYQAWGSECVTRLNGMFAFAIWDETRQELFCARDRLGEKPFYFYQSTEREFLVFGSEIKSLISSRLFRPRPNQSAVYRYLVNREIDFGSGTIFENVQALPAGHALRFSWQDRSLKIWRYWDLDPEHEIRLPNVEEYAARFLEILSDSLRIRLRSDVPVGSSLSGGLDSSTIVGLIARSGARGGQKTFSARFREPRFDEGRYIDLMTRFAHVEGHYVYPDPQQIPGEIEQLTWHQDEPFYSSSIYAQWCVMRLAKECGVTVLLDGQGGDEVLAGYHEYFGAYYVHLLRKLRWMQALSSFGGYVLDHGSSLLPLVLSNLVPAKLRFAVKGWVRPRALRKEFKSAWGRPPVCVRRKYRDEINQALYETLTRTILPQLLRYADRNSMAFSREVRLPFLDHRLIEFLFALPLEQKIDGTETKVVLRSAICGIVPEDIRNRKDKLGFSPPEVSWLLGPLRSWVDEIFSSPEFRQREWWEPATVDEVWKRFKQGEGGLHTSIWRWLSLEIWARTCLVPKPTRNSAPALLASTITRQ